MDFDLCSMSGAEFELFCQELLSSAGFEVEITQQSGDGGVDLIAYSHQPFFAGKYIIQCKRYAGSVGEPIIRDLYGVVMAERANKGILITTGHFTNSAKQFAVNKNLELIDGNQLFALVSKYRATENNTANSSIHFTQHDAFNGQRYQFFKDLIAHNRFTKEQGQDFLFRFLYQYFVPNRPEENDAKFEVIQSGLAEEYMRLFDWYAEKFHKQRLEKDELIPLYTMAYKGLAQLYSFDLFDYVQSRYAVFNQGIAQLSKHEFCELMNLLSVFSYFHIDIGVAYVNFKLCGSSQEIMEWVAQAPDYQAATQGLRLYLFHVYSEYKGSKYISSRADQDDFVDITSYFEKYSTAFKEKINLEIGQIREFILSVSPTFQKMINVEEGFAPLIQPMANPCCKFEPQKYVAGALTFLNKRFLVKVSEELGNILHAYVPAPVDLITYYSAVCQPHPGHFTGYNSFSPWYFLELSLKVDRKELMAQHREVLTCNAMADICRKKLNRPLTEEEIRLLAELASMNIPGRIFIDAINDSSGDFGVEWARLESMLR